MVEVSPERWWSPPTALTLAHLEWLRGKGPDEWHRAALGWNLSTSFHTPAWIVSQPGCDRGTVIALFHRCEPSDFLRCRVPDLQAHLARYGRSDAFELMMMIIDRWREGAYPRYEFEPIPGIVWDFPKVRATELAFAVPDDLAAPEIKGTRLVTDDYAEGFAPAFRQMARASGLMR